MSLADFFCREGLSVDTLLASPLLCYEELLWRVGKKSDELNLILVLQVESHIADVHTIQLFHLLVLLSVGFLHRFLGRLVVERHLLDGIAENTVTL